MKKTNFKLLLITTLILITVSSLFFISSAKVFAQTPTLTSSNLTATSVVLNATGLNPNDIYMFEIRGTAITLTLRKGVTASSTGIASASFSNLNPNSVYSASISKQNTTTGALTSSGAPVLYFTTLATTPSPPPTPPPTNSDTGLIPCTDNCQFNDVMKLINNVMDFIFKNLVLPFSAIMFAYAGFELVTSGGETSKREKAKKIFTNVAIGLIVVAGAFLIVKTILSIAGYNTGNGWIWFGF
jgi:hypothetical protein